MNDVDRLAALIRAEDGDHSPSAGELAEVILGSEWLKRRDSEKWAEGAYDFTNGKWGLPEKGENPYGDWEDE